MSPINFLHRLQKDHAAIDRGADGLKEALFNLRYEGKGSLGKNLRQVKGSLHFFGGELFGHMQLEEEVLFPYIEKCLPRLGSVISLLKLEHDSLKKDVKQMNGLIRQLSSRAAKESPQTKIESLRERGIYWIYLLESHVEVENDAVYKVINRELRRNEKQELAKKILQYQHR